MVLGNHPWSPWHCSAPGECQDINLLIQAVSSVQVTDQHEHGLWPVCTYLSVWAHVRLCQCPQAGRFAVGVSWLLPLLRAKYRLYQFWSQAGCPLGIATALIECAWHALIGAEADIFCHADTAQPYTQRVPGNGTIIGGLACSAPVPMVAAGWLAVRGLHSH